MLRAAALPDGPPSTRPGGNAAGPGRGSSSERRRHLEGRGAVAAHEGGIRRTRSRRGCGRGQDPGGLLLELGRPGRGCSLLFCERHVAAVFSRTPAGHDRARPCELAPLAGSIGQRSTGTLIAAAPPRAPHRAVGRIATFLKHLCGGSETGCAAWPGAAPHGRCKCLILKRFRNTSGMARKLLVGYASPARRSIQ